MDPELLPAPTDLWWSATADAALARAGAPTAAATRLEERALVLACEQADGSWLRMQRCRGGRYVLWGRSPAAVSAPGDVRREAPDWALSEATDEGRPTFVAWFAHGEWDAVTAEGELVHRLLRPWLSVDPRLARLAAEGRLGTESLRGMVGTAAHPGKVTSPGGAEADLRAAAALLERARSTPGHAARGSVRSRLLDQVHHQMREATESDRMLLQQPPELVRWARAHAPDSSFEHAVILRRGVMLPAPTNTALPRSVRDTLDNVLRQLHRQEAAEEHGAWLFARVCCDRGLARLDRAFDHWPGWWRAAHSAQGHSLAELAWEIDQRRPSWRPSWSSLLPVPAR